MDRNGQASHRWKRGAGGVPATTLDLTETPYEYGDYANERADRELAWSIGVGLQKIDGLELSQYAKSLISDQITHGYSYREVESKLKAYYTTGPGKAAPAASLEADLTATRIAEIISEPGFTLSPGSLMAIHERIFDGVFAKRSWAGSYRDAPKLSKAEPVLGGQSVLYTPGSEVRATLRWEFDEERQLDFNPRNDVDAVQHILGFTSRIWQIHPFWEGNTRATTAFAIKYLRSVGVQVDNRPFLESSPYFRDALVLDNAPVRLRNRRPLKLFGDALLNPNVQLTNLRAQYPLPLA